MIVPMYALAVAGGVASIVFSTNLEQAQLQRDIAAEQRVALVEKSARAIRFFFQVNARFPVDRAELAAAPGGEFLREVPEGALTYVVANDVSDGTYTYDRVAVFTERPGYGGADNLARDLTPAQRLDGAENQCGTEPFATAPDFCFPEGEVEVFTADTRYDLIENIGDIRLNLRETLKDFAVGFVHGGAMPNTRADGTNMAIGDSAPLHQIMNAPATNNLCDLNYRFEETLLDCEDLFEPMTGNEIVYVYEGPLRMTLVVDSGILNASTGNNVLIAQSLDIPLL